MATSFAEISSALATTSSSRSLGMKTTPLESAITKSPGSTFTRPITTGTFQACSTILPRAVEETVEDVEEEEKEEEQAEEAVEEEQAEQPEEEQAEQSEESVEETVEDVLVVTDNLCSLKTLVDVLGKWSGGEIRRRNVEDLLKEGSEVDENLDDLEKVVEVLQIWVKEGGSIFREHNHFKNLDEYTLSSESNNLSEEKKVEVLKTVTELVVNVSQRKVTNEEIQNVLNTLY